VSVLTERSASYDRPDLLRAVVLAPQGVSELVFDPQTVFRLDALQWFGAPGARVAEVNRIELEVSREAGNERREVPVLPVQRFLPDGTYQVSKLAPAALVGDSYHFWLRNPTNEPLVGVLFLRGSEVTWEP
jgi:hypothetical protein